MDSQRTVSIRSEHQQPRSIPPRHVKLATVASEWERDRNKIYNTLPICIGESCYSSIDKMFLHAPDLSWNNQVTRCFISSLTHRATMQAQKTGLARRRLKGNKSWAKSIPNSMHTHRLLTTLTPTATGNAPPSASPPHQVWVYSHITPLPPPPHKDKLVNRPCLPTPSCRS